MCLYSYLNIVHLLLADTVTSSYFLLCDILRFLHYMLSPFLQTIILSEVFNFSVLEFSLSQTLRLPILLLLTLSEWPHELTDTTQ